MPVGSTGGRPGAREFLEQDQLLVERSAHAAVFAWPARATHPRMQAPLPVAQDDRVEDLQPVPVVLWQPGREPRADFRAEVPALVGIVGEEQSAHRFRFIASALFGPDRRSSTSIPLSARPPSSVIMSPLR
jgi:hypothetical protein